MNTLGTPELIFPAPEHFGLSVKRPDAGADCRNTLTGTTRLGRKLKMRKCYCKTLCFFFCPQRTTEVRTRIWKMCCVIGGKNDTFTFLFLQQPKSTFAAKLCIQEETTTSVNQPEVHRHLTTGCRHQHDNTNLNQLSFNGLFHHRHASS